MYIYLYTFHVAKLNGISVFLFVTLACRGMFPLLVVPAVVMWKNVNVLVGIGVSTFLDLSVTKAVNLAFMNIRVPQVKWQY